MLSGSPRATSKPVLPATDDQGRAPRLPEPEMAALMICILVTCWTHSMQNSVLVTSDGPHFECMRCLLCDGARFRSMWDPREHHSDLPRKEALERKQQKVYIQHQPLRLEVERRTDNRKQDTNC